MQDSRQTNSPSQTDEPPEGYSTETVDDKVALLVPTSSVLPDQIAVQHSRLGRLSHTKLLLLTLLILLIVVIAIVFSVIKGYHF